MPKAAEGFVYIGLIIGVIIYPWLGLSLMGVMHMRLFTLIAGLALAAHGKTMLTDPGAVPDQAMPSVPVKSKAVNDKLLSGNCKGPTHCCCATFPVTLRSTLFVNQSLQATASRESTSLSAEINWAPSPIEEISASPSRL